MSEIKSPLRYPGGKAELIDYIEKLIISNNLSGCSFYEPFAGGASVSIGLLQRGVVDKVTLVEKDPLVYAFWQSVFFHTDELCSKIEDANVSIDTWNKLTNLRNIDIPVSTLITELGFAALFFNRTNFSGILKAGPIGGKNQEGKYKIDCRFNKKKLLKIITFLSLYRDRVDIVWSDGVTFIRDHNRRLTQENSFVYIDPPYYEKGKSLYRFYFENEHHVELSKHLKSSNFPWLLSYDNCVFINDLYIQEKRRTLFFDYSVNTTKKEKELLISNLEIPPIEDSSQTSEPICIW